MRNNYSQGGRTAQLQKTKAGYNVFYTEHNGLMTYSRWFGERSEAVNFALDWIARIKA